MQNLIIIGAGGLGREVYDLAVDAGTYIVRGFVDANPAASPGVVPVLGTPDAYEIQPGDVFICAIGNPTVRRKCVEQLQQRGAHFTTLIHPTAIVSPTAKIAQGCIIKPYVTIGSLACVGKHTVVQPHTTLEHDVRVGSFCLIGAGSVMQGATTAADSTILKPLTLVPYA